MKISFTIDGEPVGKARPRMNTRTGRAYTPDKTRIYEEYTKMLYKSKVKHYFEGYVRLTIKAFYGIARSDSKKIKEQKVNNTLRPSKKPDIDNVIKLIADSLNEIAYKDDTQIVEIEAMKYYSDNPRVEVTIEAL